MAITDNASTGFERMIRKVIAGNTADTFLPGVITCNVLILDLSTGLSARVNCKGGSNATRNLDANTVQFVMADPGATSNKIGVYWNGAAYVIHNRYAAAHTFSVFIFSSS